MPPFQKGQSGNPNGRPKKGATLTDALERHLASKLSMLGTNKKQEARDALAEQVVAIALAAPSPADRMTAIKFIYDRIDGKMPNRTEVTGGTDDDGNEKPIPLIVYRASKPTA